MFATHKWYLDYRLCQYQLLFESRMVEINFLMDVAIKIHGSYIMIHLYNDRYALSSYFYFTIMFTRYKSSLGRSLKIKKHHLWGYVSKITVNTRLEHINIIVIGEVFPCVSLPQSSCAWKEVAREELKSQ